MAKKRTVAGTKADAMLPRTPIEIRGKMYDLCFDFGAIAEAETAINGELLRAGREDRVNLLIALCEQNLANTRALFAGCIRTFHPEIGFDQAVAMVGPDNVFAIAMAMRDAWSRSIPEPEKPADPPVAQTAK
jgi:hypothetical protein